MTWGPGLIKVMTSGTRRIIIPASWAVTSKCPLTPVYVCVYLPVIKKKAKSELMESCFCILLVVYKTEHTTFSLTRRLLLRIQRPVTASRYFEQWTAYISLDSQWPHCFRVSLESTRIDACIGQIHNTLCCNCKLHRQSISNPLLPLLVFV